MAPMLPALAANGIGVVLLHGKNPGSPTTSRQLEELRQAFPGAACAAEMPNMPWSLRRYIDGGWTKAMEEIGAALAAQRAGGARFLVLAGQSLGTAAAISYAALRGDIDALVATAPGHVPRQYYDSPKPFAMLVRQSVDEARSLVAQGFGQNMGRWSDINQGNTLSVSMRAADYLTYFDPNGDAEMTNVAPRVPGRIPVLMVVGNRDDAAH
ncbi:MAG: alpha/beta hydrolase [Alphaproteobacteria bacterium]|nr:alpha/beta hydrolase [Alphaproteobacteria bacterium]